MGMWKRVNSCITILIIPHLVQIEFWVCMTHCRSLTVHDNVQTLSGWECPVVPRQDLLSPLYTLCRRKRGRTSHLCIRSVREGWLFKACQEYPPRSSTYIVAMAPTSVAVTVKDVQYQFVICVVFPCRFGNGMNEDAECSVLCTSMHTILI